jgi:methionine aminopeptidase
MLSHQLQQNTIDGEKTIIQNPNEAQKKEYEKCTFEVNEVYAVDVLISTGEGQVKNVPCRNDSFCADFFLLITKLGIHS